MIPHRAPRLEGSHLPPRLPPPRLHGPGPAYKLALVALTAFAVIVVAALRYVSAYGVP